MTGVLTKGEKTQRHTGGTPCEDGGRDQSHASPSHRMPKNDPPSRLRRKYGLSTPQVWISHLNCERLSLCCFEPPNLWYFVTVALGNEYRHLQQKTVFQTPTILYIASKRGIKKQMHIFLDIILTKLFIMELLIHRE